MSHYNIIHFIISYQRLFRNVKLVVFCILTNHKYYDIILSKEGDVFEYFTYTAE